MTVTGGSAALGMRRALLLSGARRVLRENRESGGLVVSSYALVVGSVLLYGAWQDLAVPDLPLPAWILAWVSSATLFAATFRRGPLLWTDVTDEFLLAMPQDGRATLTWMLLRALAPGVALASAAGLLLWVFVPAWRAAATVLPAGVTAALLFSVWSWAARRAGVRTALRAARLLSLAPLLTLTVPRTLLVIILALAAAALVGLSRLVVSATLPALRDELHWAGLVHGARALNLPPPRANPHMVPGRLRRPLPLVGEGPFAAVLWRSALHLLPRTWRALPVLLLVPAVTLLSSGTLSVAALGVLLTGALLAPLGSLLGPAAPEGYPVTPAHARLGRTLPAGALLLGLSLLSALLTTPFLPVNQFSVLAALLLPVALLSVTEWLGGSFFVTRAQATQARVLRALLPGGLLAATASFHLPLLGLLALGVLVLALFRP